MHFEMLRLVKPQLGFCVIKKSRWGVGLSHVWLFLNIEFAQNATSNNQIVDRLIGNPKLLGITLTHASYFETHIFRALEHTLLYNSSGKSQVRDHGELAQRNCLQATDTAIDTWHRELRQTTTNRQSGSKLRRHIWVILLQRARSETVYPGDNDRQPEVAIKPEIIISVGQWQIVSKFKRQILGFWPRRARQKCG